MQILTALFSFNGRLSRLTYWRAWLATSAALAVLWITTVFVAMGAGDIAVVPLLFVMPVLAISLSVCIRRLHDRDRSVWWLLPFWLGPLASLAAAQALTEQSGEGSPAALAILMIGAVLKLWAFIEIGCRRGTPGPNRFGPVPPSGLRPRRQRP